MQSDACIVIAEVRRRKTIVNAELIKQGLTQAERAIRLNRMAIDQLQILQSDELRKRLGGLPEDTPLLVKY